MLLIRDNRRAHLLTINIIILISLMPIANGSSIFYIFNIFVYYICLKNIKLLLFFSSAGGDLSMYKEKTFARDPTHLILVILLL